MSLLQTMNEYRRSASWAVWNTNSSGNLTGEAPFPRDQASSAIHGRTMFVSLNPGSGWNHETDEKVPDWANFHSPLPKHNDLFLAAALVGTQYWGSYMTDLHPELAESNSLLVRPSTDEIELSVHSLIRQAKLLGTVEQIVCVGAKSYDAVALHLPLIENELNLRDNSLIRILHYSGAAAARHRNDPQTYRAIVHTELGLGER